MVSFLFSIINRCFIYILFATVLYEQTEKTIYPITALIEATIRFELGNKEFAEQVEVLNY
jgi:hypothetical protein